MDNEQKTDEGPATPGLDALDAQALAIEGGAAAATAAPPPMPTNTAAELRSALELARITAAPAFSWWQHFPTVWGDQTLDGIANNGAAIMDRHGWTMGEVMTTWGPYIGLLATLGPAVAVTVQAVKQRQAEVKRAPERAPAEVAP